jgi:hypothetical protein
MQVAGFAPNGNFSTPLTVSTTSSNVQLPFGPTVLIANTGTGTAYIALGVDNSVVATANTIPVAAGGTVNLAVGQHTYLAAITLAGTTTINIAGGSGLFTGVGGGGSGGGGGGGAVTQATIPWSDNISQFGGANVVTGTGASGAGIPRVTVSNDSAVIGNITQFGGSNIVTGTGASGAGVPRVTVSSDSTLSATIGGFTPNGNISTPLAVTTSTGNVALPAGTVVVVGNSGTSTAFVTLGVGAGTVSTVGGIPVAPGGIFGLTVGSNTFLAAITSSGTATINLAGGTGLFSGAGSGGGGGSGGGSVTQGTSPWVDNVSQFGGSAVVTGIGVSGPGIPRVTVSSDSNLSASIAGFTPNGSVSTPLSATTATGNVALPTGAVVIIGNSGTSTAFITLGVGSGTVSTASGIPVAPGSIVGLTVGSNTFLAAITAAGTATINIAGGTGLFSGAGGGGTGGGGGGSVTQGTSPWVDNITQFGGSAVVTGTGAAGAGIPRVTVSNDSVVTANQGTTPWVTTPNTTTPTTLAGGTVTTGGAFQTALAANTLRTAGAVQNTSTHTAYVYWLGSGTATLLNSRQIYAGGVFDCMNASGAVIKTAVQWTTGTTGDPFVVSENQ